MNMSGLWRWLWCTAETQQQVPSIQPIQVRRKSDVQRSTVQVLYTMEEIAGHSKKDSLWIVISNGVYDVSNFHDHPGGYDQLLGVGGEDATSQFYAIHDEYVLKTLTRFKIGTVGVTSMHV